MAIFRFQNFCFLAIFALMLTMLFCDMCHTQSVDYSVQPPVVEEVTVEFNESIAFVVLVSLIMIVAVAGLVSCPRPPLQLRFALIDMTLLLCFQIWIAVFFFRMKDQYAFSIGAMYPLVSLILDMLAIRFILKDIAQDAAHDFYHTVKKVRLNVNNGKQR